MWYIMMAIMFFGAGVNNFNVGALINDIVGWVFILGSILFLGIGWYESLRE